MSKLLLLLLNGAKLSKLLMTSGTMLLSMFAYSWLFGWPYAIGFVLLILVHEMGHYLAARQRGLAVGAPTFIPFVGAWIELKQLPHNAETEAYVGIAGPLAGTIGAIVCFYAARGYDSALLLALAYAGCMLNLFNLIPLHPLDGGRVTQVISPKLWFVGIPVLVALFLYRPSPMLILIAILAAPQVWRMFRGTGDTSDTAYHLTSPETRLGYGALYLGLAAFLAIMSHELHQELPRGF